MPERTQAVTNKHPSSFLDTTFESGFYFSEVRSDTVDIEFVVEGNEPIWLERITAHAHPDVIYREFERGLVVANPSPRPFVFHLDGSFEDKNYRRLLGSDTQDPVTNNGQPVRDSIRIGPRDAIFLVTE